MRDGVTMRDPSTVYVDWDVTLAADVTLEPNVVLRGETSVGEGTDDRRGHQIIDSHDRRGLPRLGERSSRRRRSRTARRSARSATSGRGSVVGTGAEIGNFAELKNAPLGAGVKQHHMSYLGDAELGDGTNVGAGTITANYDGTTKHRTTIGDGVFLGVDTMLVAPRSTIGEGRQDRCRRRRHEGRAGRQARGRRAGTDPRAPRRNPRRTTRRARSDDAASRNPRR